MNFIIFCALLALSSASYPIAHHYPINIPVIGKYGVPLESPAIVHARQAHLSHVAAVKARDHLYGGYEGYDNYGGIYATGYGGHGGYAIPIIGHNGVPIDTPEVQAAKALHFAAHAKAATYGGGLYEHYRRRRSVYGYAQPLIGHNGVPLDTPEVQAAKLAHFAAHAKAAALTAGAGYGSPGYGKYGAGYGAGYGGYGAGYGGAYGGHHGGYHGPIHIPVIGPKGVPIDTPEVQAARHKHFEALAAAHAKSGGGYYEQEKPYYYY